MRAWFWLHAASALGSYVAILRVIPALQQHLYKRVGSAMAEGEHFMEVGATGRVAKGVV